ncbi:hypothetical protein KB879_33175 (plasmid) [Cupriavidus sp. KK10]|uniref:hypothetical protein n=1 Tax=Cupriavidus sp. KK10 TaxID=1478019 RepID=UPI001BA5A6F4|nr:hypothetical protein [Cupriavidus sp. KK10]QUN32492.1 hypothetical protein KB879_33175 [Cupriavidus sp. KK10]
MEASMAMVPLHSRGGIPVSPDDANRALHYRRQARRLYGLPPGRRQLAPLSIGVDDCCPDVERTLTGAMLLMVLASSMYVMSIALGHLGDVLR